MSAHKELPAPEQRMSVTTLHEAYFDLWGFSMEWIDKICDALHDYADPGQDDEAEAYKCEACMAFRFRSPNPRRTMHARQVFVRMAREATEDQRRTGIKDNGKVFYTQA